MGNRMSFWKIPRKRHWYLAKARAPKNPTTMEMTVTSSATLKEVHNKSCTVELSTALPYHLVA